MPYAGIGDTTRRNLPDYEAMAAQYGTPSHERMWCAYEQDKATGRNQTQAWVGGIPPNVPLPEPSPFARGSNAGMLSRLEQARQEVRIDEERREIQRSSAAHQRHGQIYAAAYNRPSIYDPQPSTSSAPPNRPNFNVRNPFSDANLGRDYRGGFGGFGR